MTGSLTLVSDSSGHRYKVILQREGEWAGTYDYLVKCLDDGTYARIWGYSFINRSFRQIDRYGKLKSKELKLKKSEFIYK